MSDSNIRHKIKLLIAEIETLMRETMRDILDFSKNGDHQFLNYSYGRESVLASMRSELEILLIEDKKSDQILNDYDSELDQLAM